MAPITSLLTRCFFLFSLTLFCNSTLLRAQCDPVDVNTFSTVFIPDNTAHIDFASEGIVNSSGEYVILGFKEKGTPNTFLSNLVFVRLDPQGNLVSPPKALVFNTFAEIFFFTNANLLGVQLIETFDSSGSPDGYAGVATYRDAGPQRKVLLFRLNTFGDVLWAQEMDSSLSPDRFARGLHHNASNDTYTVITQGGTSGSSIEIFTVQGSTCNSVIEHQPIGLPLTVSASVEIFNMSNPNAAYAITGNAGPNGNQVFILILDQMLLPIDFYAFYDLDNNSNTREEPYAIEQDGNNLVIVGTMPDGNGDNAFLLKVQAVDFSGNFTGFVQDAKRYDLADDVSPGNESDVALSITADAGSGYAIAGNSNQGGGSLQSFLLRTQPNGTPIWSRRYTYQNYGNSTAFNVEAAQDDSYFLVGSQFVSGTTDVKIWAAKTDTQGKLSNCDCYEDIGVTTTNLAPDFSSHPNTSNTLSCLPQSLTFSNPDLANIVDICDQGAPSMTPTISCPANITVDCTVDFSNPANTGGSATASGGCNPSIPLQITPSDAVNSADPCQIVVTRTWTATDDCGNTDMCTQIIQVVDTAAPTVTNCPGDFTVQGSPDNMGVCVTNVALPVPTATDDCNNALYAYTLSGATTGSGTDANSNVTLNQGLTTVNWTIEDDCGNATTCSYIVNFICVNTTCPNCPGNVVTNGDFQQGAFVNWADNTGSPQGITADFCGDPVSLQIWGNQDVGEAIIQTGVNFQTGFTYSISFCARFLPIATSNTPYVQFGFTASNGSINPFTNGSAYNMGTTAASANPTLPFITSTAWTCYTLPDWTPQQNYSDLIINAFNSIPDNMGGGSIVSWGRIDNICITATPACAMTCPMNLNVPNDPGQCDAFVNVPPPTLTGGCSSCVFTNDFTGTNDASSTYPVGCTTVTWTLSCNGLTIETCSMQVCVDDTEPPGVSCNNLSVDVSNGSITLNPNDIGTATDNCGVVSESLDDTLVDCQDACGTVMITYTATDGAGLSSSCVGVVTVSETIAPAIQCPINLSIDCAQDPNDLSLTGQATATDNCDPSPTITFTDQVFSAFCNPTIERTWIATDDCGNVSSCSPQIIQIIDSTAPVITQCPSDMTFPAPPDNQGNCQTTVNLIVPTATDDCSNVAWTYTLSGATTGSGTVANLVVVINQGTTTISWTATDACGNSETCTYDVIYICVNNTCGPCPGNVVANGDFQQGALVNWVDNTGSPQGITADFCGDPISLQMWGNQDVGEATIQTGVNFQAGTTYSISFCARFVPVPTANTPYVQFGFTASNGSINPFTNGNAYNIGATAATPGSPSPFINSTAWACYTIPNWTPQQNFTDLIINAFNSIPDNMGGAAIVSWGRIDNICITALPPCAMSCPANITVPNDPGLCSAFVNVPPPTFTGACDPCSFTNDFNFGNDASGVYPVGCTTVTWTLDCTGLGPQTCTTIVCVNDTEPPMVTCADFQVDISNGPITIQPSAVGSATDNCSVTNETLDINFFDCSVACSTVTVTYTAFDAAGNSNSCTANVTVDEFVDPIASCPSDIVIDCTEDPNDLNLTGRATGTDNCDPIPTMSFSDQISIGNPCDIEIQRIWTATDDCQNTGQCTQVIHLVDTSPPMIGCPAGITIDCTQDPNDLSLTGQATAGDDCQASPSLTFVDNVSINDPCDIVIQRIWTANDGCTNTSNCTQIIHIIDNMAPTLLSCPPDIIVQGVEVGPLGCQAIANVLPPVVDDCSANISFSYLLSGATTGTGTGPLSQSLAVGVTTIAWTATDPCGNAAVICSNTVTVNPCAPCTITCPSTIMVGNDAGQCNAFVSVPQPTLDGSCFGCTLTNDYNGSSDASDTYPIGCTTVTWTMSNCDNSPPSSCTMLVCVEDTEPPSISCPLDITVTAAIGTNGANVNWNSNIASDNCLLTITGTSSPGDFFPCGITPVSYAITETTTGDVYPCNFNVSVLCPNCPTCSNNIVQNGGFQNGAVGGSMPNTGASNNWMAVNIINSTPQVILPDFCGDQVSIQMYGNQTSGEAISQNGIAIQAGVTYQISFCARLITSIPNSSNFVQFGFSASNGFFNPFPNGPNIGNALVTNTNWACYTLPNWTAPQNYSTLTINPFSNVPGNVMYSWGRIDNICITPVQLCTANFTSQETGFPFCGMVQFTDQSISSLGTVSSWNWSVDGNPVSTSQNFTYSFPNSGTYNVCLTITDNQGCNDQFCQNVTVNFADVPPQISCPANQLYNTDPGACHSTQIPPDAVITAASLCDPNATLSCIRDDGLALTDPYPVGVTTVTCTATNSFGSSLCSYTVTVEDNQPPTPPCPGDETVVVPVGSGGSAVNFFAFMIDNCGNGNVGVIPLSPAPNQSGDFFPLGCTTVTLQATDGSLNQSTCSFDVCVEEDCGDCSTFAADVAAGFQLSQPSSISCVRTFTPLQLGPCDQVSWTVSPSISNPPANTTGNMPASAILVDQTVYKVSMTVTRVLPDGTVCGPLDYIFPPFFVDCSSPPPNICASTANGDFQNGLANWQIMSGEPILEAGEGCQDPGYVVLSGNRDDADIIAQELSDLPSNEEMDFLIHVCLNSELQNTILPGTRLVVRTANEPPNSIDCLDDCDIIGIIDIDNMDDWPPQDPMFTKYMFNSIVFHVENDLEDDGTPDSRSLVAIDNVCVEYILEVDAEEPFFDPNIRLFPNPTNQQLQVRFSAPLQQKIPYRLIDLWGRELMGGYIDFGQQNHQLDLSAYPSGLYFFEVGDTQNGFYREKVIKQ